MSSPRSSQAPQGVNQCSSQFDEAQQQLNLIKHALEPQAQGQITRAGWAGLEVALLCVERALQEGAYNNAIVGKKDCQIEELTKFLETTRAEAQSLRAGLALKDLEDDKFEMIKEAFNATHDLLVSCLNVADRKGYGTAWENLAAALNRQIDNNKTARRSLGLIPSESFTIDPSSLATGVKTVGPYRGLSGAEMEAIAKEGNDDGAPSATGMAAALPLLLAGLLLLLSSCAHYKNVSPSGEKTTFTAVGTNAKTIDAGDLHIAGLNQSVGLEKAGEAVGNIVKMQITGRLIGAGIDATKTVADSTIDALKK